VSKGLGYEGAARGSAKQTPSEIRDNHCPEEQLSKRAKLGREEKSLLDGDKLHEQVSEEKGGVGVKPAL